MEFLVLVASVRLQGAAEVFPSFQTLARSTDLQAATFSLLRPTEFPETSGSTPTPNERKDPRKRLKNKFSTTWGQQEHIMAESAFRDAWDEVNEQNIAFNRSQKQCSAISNFSGKLPSDYELMMQRNLEHFSTRVSSYKRWAHAHKWH